MDEQQESRTTDSVFTDFVRTLGAGAVPTRRAVDVLRRSLRMALATEIRRRGLWDSPPSYLGVYGATRWHDALDELAADCFSFIFVDRLRGLAAQLRVKPNVDGLVFVNVRHFVHEAQKRHDPVGFRVFVVLRAALLRLLEAGRLQLWNGDPRVRNHTLLGFGLSRPGCECSAEDLENAVARWAGELMPDLVTARGDTLEAFIARLGEHVAALSADGILAFRFKSLVDLLKGEVRARWAVALESGDGRLGIAHTDPARPGRLLPFLPETSLEEKETFERLRGHVVARIEDLPESERTRGCLRRLFEHLVRHADGRFESRGGKEDPQGRLSHRELARILDIPRDRLPGLFDTLGRLIGEYRARVGPRPYGGRDEARRTVPRGPEERS